MIRAGLASVAIAFALSCGSPQASSPAPAKPTADTTTGAGDSPAKTPPAAKPNKKDERAKQIAKAIERVPTITTKVGELRGLEVKEAVPAEHQSKEDFRAYLAREVEKELPPEKNAAMSRAVHHIGLVKSEIDLASTMLNAFATQAAAYYDPAVNKFFIVAPFGGPGGLDMITAHELTHGLQHQHFDLLAYYGQEPKQLLTEDQLNARRFVVEGEATLLMIVYMGGKQLLEGKGVDMLGASIKMMAAQDTLTMIKDQQRMASTANDPELEAQMAGMDKIPLYIMVPLIDSYTRGAVQVFHVFKAGGWKAVDDLYKNPPDSTEQVLHPDTKLVGKRDYPVAITMPKPTALKGYKKVHGDVLGELSWRAYFMTWSIATPEKLAAGWDGDRVEIWAKGDKQTTGLIATTWDTKDDAAEFAAGYASSLKKRFPDAKPTRKGSTVTHKRDSGTVVMVEQRGKDVLIVDGAPPTVAKKLLVRLRKAKKKKHAKDK